MTFKSIFKRECDPFSGNLRWRIKGSGVRSLPEDAQLVRRVVECLEKNGISIRRYHMDSPMNVLSHHLEARFQDGGLTASTGTAFFGERGTWITGIGALMYVCGLLDVTIPEDEVIVGSIKAFSMNEKPQVSTIEEKLVPYVEKVQVAEEERRNDIASCFSCVHSKAKRVGVTTGVQWCELDIDTFPKRCSQFESRYSDNC